MAVWSTCAVLAACALCARGQAVAVADIALVAARNYDKGCVVLLYSGTALQREVGRHAALAEVLRLLSREGVAATALSVQATTFQQAGQKCKEKSPLLVLWDADIDSRRFIKDALSSRWPLGAGWLVMVQEPRRFLERVNLRFDSNLLAATRGPEGGYALAELYRASPTAELTLCAYGSWSAGGGVVFSASTKLLRRRPGLQRAEIRATYTRKDYVMEEIIDENGRTQKNGLFGMIWKTLEEIANFTTKFHENKSGGYGIQYHGSWNGMVEMLRRDEVDVAVGDFTMTTTRQSVIDFTVPLITTSFVVYIRVPSEHVLNWACFTSPFSVELWGWLVGSLPAVAAFAWATHRAGLRAGGPETPLRWRCGFHTAPLSVLRPLFQQGHESSPQSWSCRTVFLTLYLTAQVLYAAYSASLVSSLTKRLYDLPFSDIRGLMQDGTFSFEVTRMSAEYELFQMSNNSLMKAVFNRYLADQSVLPFEDTTNLHILCSDPKKAVLQAKELAKASASRLPCCIVSLPSTVFQTSLAIAVAKYSPYRGIINYYLLQLLETGVSNKIKAMYDGLSACEQQDEGWSQVDMLHVVPILAVMAGGVAASILVLLLELCVHMLASPPDACTTSAAALMYLE